MDGQQFDNVTRALATARSRRAALKVLGAGLAAGMSGALKVPRARAATTCGPPNPLLSLGRCDTGLVCPLNSTCSGTGGGSRCVCNTGFCSCDNNPGNGCEANLNTDVNNCGAC